MSTSMSSPAAFFAAFTSNAHSVRAMFSVTDADPRCMPGQMRRPQPNALWPNVPGYSRSSRKRSGLNSCGSGKSASFRWTEG